MNGVCQQGPLSAGQPRPTPVKPPLAITMIVDARTMTSPVTVTHAPAAMTSGPGKSFTPKKLVLAEIVVVTGVAAADALALELAVELMLGDELAPTDTDATADSDADGEEAGEADAEHAAPPAPGQPQIVTPAPGLGAPVPSPRAVRTVSVTAAGAPSARVTRRRPALVMFSSASTVLPSSGRDELAVMEPTDVPGSPCTSRLATREPQSTSTVPGAPVVSTPFVLDGPVQAEPTPPAALNINFQSDHEADGYECASQSTAIRPPPPPPPCGYELYDVPPGPPCAVTEPTEYPSTRARSNTLPPLPPPPPS